MKSGCSLDLFPSRCYLRKRASCVCMLLFLASSSYLLPLSDPPLSLSLSSSLPLCLYLSSPSPFCLSHIHIHIYIHSCYLPTSRPVSTALPPRPAHKYKSWIIDSKANVGEYCAIGGKPLFTTRARPDERTNNASVCGFPPLLYESYRIYRFRVLHRFEKSFEPR